ncbi:MAG: hypothetical protein AAGI44_09025 [Pseudomonadota bacterium]
MPILIWGGALLAYAAFRLWYDGFRKPLSPQEIDEFVEIVQSRAGNEVSQDDIAVVRRFLEGDDGKEFIMVNLLELNSSPVEHPETGEPVRADAMLSQYFKPFMGEIIRRAGHPVLTSRAVGGYLDAWNTPADPGWHLAGLMRYRSRRDCILSSLANPRFSELHKFKVAALKQTFAFPSQTLVTFYASPRWSVAMLLALAAAMLQLTLN